MILEIPKARRPKRMTYAQLKNVIRESINEALGSFPNQYKIARLCTDNFFDMFDKEETERTLNVNEHGIDNIILRVDNDYWLIATNITRVKNNILISVVNSKINI